MTNIENQNLSTIFDFKAWRAVILAILAVIIVSFVLSWQYKRMAAESEEKLSSLEDVVEESLVEDALDRFMMARINKNEAQAGVYLTEKAMEQKENGEFVLVDDFESYQVMGKNKLQDSQSNSFEFIVKLYSEDKVSNVVEIIVLAEIMDDYYIDSVIIGG